MNSLLKVDGHDDAIIGVGESFNRQMVLVYSEQIIIKNLMKMDMSEEEAVEFYHFNIIKRNNNKATQYNNFFVKGTFFHKFKIFSIVLFIFIISIF